MDTTATPKSLAAVTHKPDSTGGLSIVDKRALPRHLQGAHLQAAMLEALAALVTIHARRHPTVLLLEDWHWADESSASLLEHLLPLVETESAVQLAGYPDRVLRREHRGDAPLRGSRECVCDERQ